MNNDNEKFIQEYLEASENKNKVTEFWNKYNHKPAILINEKQYWHLRERIYKLLRDCKKINEDAFNKIHKGNPYYFIAISSYLLSDILTAIYFFDASVTEDIRYGADPKQKEKSTPSTHFVMLQGDEPRQYAQALTKDTEEKVKRAINHYNDQIKKAQNFGMENLRDAFIYPSLMTRDKSGLRTLATVFNTYFIEWDFRNTNFDLGVKYGTSEPIFSHLFRGCLLFESLLHHYPTNQKKFKGLGEIFSNPEIIEKLGINKIEGKKDGFSLDDVIDTLKNYDNTIQEAIRITYMARNALGHTLGWNVNISKEEYQKLYFIVASSCLHVINCLWR